jgi:hypothetical protein
VLASLGSDPTITLASPATFKDYITRPERLELPAARGVPGIASDLSREALAGTRQPAACRPVTRA